MKHAAVVTAAGVLICAASALGAGAGCSASNGNGNGGDLDAAGGGDGSSADSGAAKDSSSGNDGGVGSDGGAGGDAPSDAPKDTGPACTSLVNDGGISPTCDTCELAHCCNEFNACWGDSDCVALIGCSFDCVADAGTGDAGAACEGVCEQQHQGAVNAFHAWLFCTNASCRTECSQ